MHQCAAFPGVIQLVSIITLTSCGGFGAQAHGAAVEQAPAPRRALAPLPATPPPAATSGAVRAPDTNAAATAAAEAPLSTAAVALSPARQVIERADAGSIHRVGASSAFLIKVQVLLDRAHFSPGAIDGRFGGNLSHAIMAYQRAHGMSADGVAGPALVGALVKADPDPVTRDYVVTPADVAGPFLGKTPTDLLALSKLRHADYGDSAQELAERFHMSQTLLRAMNPGAEFSIAGVSIIVVRPGDAKLLLPVARVEVDKATNQVRAFDAKGTVEAVFPATVGSTERPAPAGVWAVRLVTQNPDYTYDPSKLTFGPKAMGVLTIPPGPNNPVGTTWIALTKPTYGIHGSPDPTLIGKRASHGCVRLTNWDAAALGHAVVKGTPVVFLGETTKH